MIWETVDPRSVAEWVARQQLESPMVDAFRVNPPGVIEEIVRDRFGVPPTAMRVHPLSGAVDVDVRQLGIAGDQGTQFLALDLATALDRRHRVRWEPDPEEQGSPPGIRTAISWEMWLEMEGLKPVGPGGRISYYGRRGRMEIVCRSRGTSLGGHWRDPEAVAQGIIGSFGNDLGTPLRLRAGLGYFEASKHEEQEVIRPAVVALLDQVERDAGPRWRLATVEAATDLDEAPPTAGLESAMGCA